MSPIWIWGVALVFYGGFELWYGNWSGPLVKSEIDGYLERFEAGSEPVSPERLAGMRRFLEADDGGEFFMVNLLALPRDPVEDPESGRLRPAPEVLGDYTGTFMPALFRRAGHPAFFGRAAGTYLEAWGVEPDPGWSTVGIIRYRSRRDLMELATMPAFEGAHVFKRAALSHTLAFPAAPASVFFGPRVVVALALALLAALGHLALRALRGG